MKTFLLPISEIQPSQLYISAAKLEKVRADLRDGNLNQMTPLPVKKIGETVFFTDGHTRAFALAEQGVEELSVYFDPDPLDWLQYFICIKWCREQGLKNITDLTNRIIDHARYERVWHERCATMQKAVEQGIYESVIVEEVVDKKEKAKLCESVLRALPKWFGIEEAVQNYVEGVADTFFLKLQVGDLPLGFMSIIDHNEFTSEIYVMGLYKEFHGRGLGRMLLSRAEVLLSKDQKQFLTVKTLGDSFKDEGYERTKKFYRAMGFYPLEESNEIWGPNCPCLIMLKLLP